MLQLFLLDVVYACTCLTVRYLKAMMRYVILNMSGTIVAACLFVVILLLASYVASSGWMKVAKSSGASSLANISVENYRVLWSTLKARCGCNTIACHLAIPISCMRSYKLCTYTNVHNWKFGYQFL